MSQQSLSASFLRKTRSRRAKKKRAQLSSPSTTLRDYYARVVPRYSYPEHLAPLTSLFERIARGERVRAVVNAPPRHWKTETCMVALPWLMSLAPHKRHAYATYASSLSEAKSRVARNHARDAGLQFASDSNTLAEWTLREGGGLLAIGVDGGFTGKGVDGVLLIDDPVKNRVEAESARNKEKLLEWFRDVAFTRLEPGASCILFMTRWVPDDLAAECIRLGWEHHNLPALSDAGEALMPAWFDVAALEEIRRTVGEYTWWSLYQGAPRPRGGRLFKGTSVYTDLPTMLRYAIGVDLAYTAKKKSDYSVALVLACDALDPDPLTPGYIVDVIRRQVPAPEFARELIALQRRFPGAPVNAYVSGVEQGVVDMLNSTGAALVGEAAVADKFVRAQPAAAAWNDGRILLPSSDADWIRVLLDEVLGFTGSDDTHDDQVDALAAAFDALQSSPLHIVSGQTRETTALGRYGPPRGARSLLRRY